MKNTVLTFATLLVVSSLPTQAALIVFDDRGAWQAAAGNVDGAEDFEGFPVNTSFDGGLVQLADGMSIGTLGEANIGSYNSIQIPPTSYEGDVNGSSNAYVLGGQFDPDSSVTPFIRFADPVSAFGADFRNLNDGLMRTVIDVFDGADIIDTIFPVVMESNNLRFIGAVANAGEEISELRFRWLAPDGFGIDDIEISRISEVPSPATLALFGLGLAGLGWSRRSV